MFAEFLDGEHNVTALARKYGKTWHVTNNAIESERAAIAEMTADVETSLGRYLERLRMTELMAEELWETSTGNARSSALKSIILVAEKIAAASGVATVREASEHQSVEDFMRNLISPSMTKMPVSQRN